MTAAPKLDLAAIRQRYDTVEAGYVGYPYEPGETDVEYSERVEPQLHSDALKSAADVPALLAEVERLTKKVQPGKIGELRQYVSELEAYIGQLESGRPPTSVRPG